MNANHLMIGNHLNFAGQSVIVLEIFRDNSLELGYFADSIGFRRSLSDENLKPIRLTNLFLVKNGFDYNPHTLTWTIEEQNFDLECYSRIPGFYFNGSKIEFAHTLQNLFTVLGKELKIEL